MLWIVVTGLKPWDGRYPLDVDAGEFTTREWGWVKRHAGYLPLTVEEGLAGGDPELFAVLAAIALRRAGRVDAAQVPDLVDRIGDTPFGTTIQLEDDSPNQDADGDAGPPTRSSTGNETSSGTGSPASSETSPRTPGGSGTPDSDAAASGPIRLAT